MTPYEKLEHQDRAWSVCEAAHFLGYSKKYVYELIRENKIDGWFELNGTYRFCPAKLKAWLEKKIGENRNGGAKTDGSDGPNDNKPRLEDDDDKVA
jgi:excisionase family DNA binding protein